MIGVFDSGLGGLTVLKGLAQAFTDVDFVYLGDTARLPYGTKSPATIRHYVEQNIAFLLQQRVQAIVVACNSASSVLVEQAVEWPVPVYNVIEPGAKLANERTQSGRIGVIGTRATIHAQTYVRALKTLRPELRIFQNATPLLVSLVEEGWFDDPLTNLIVHRYLQPLLKEQIDVLILGCTHFPALRLAIQKVVGPHVELVDSVQGLVACLKEDLRTNKLSVQKTSPEVRRLRILCTDLTSRYKELAQILMQPLTLQEPELVDTIKI